MFFTVYQIKNRVNGKIYIGKHQTKNLNDDYMGSGKHLRHAIEKYGIENFEKEILFQFDNEEEMNAKESELVTEEFCLREDTYNLCPGGKGGWGYLNSSNTSNIGWKTNTKDNNYQKKGGKNSWLNMSEEQKLEKVLILKKCHEDGKIRYDGFKGKTHSNEVRGLISTLQTGKNNSQYGTMWITNGSENKKIRKTELIPEGWHPGRKISYSNKESVKSLRR